MKNLTLAVATVATCILAGLTFDAGKAEAATSLPLIVVECTWCVTDSDFDLVAVNAAAARNKGAIVTVINIPAKRAARVKVTRLLDWETKIAEYWGDVLDATDAARAEFFKPMDPSVALGNLWFTTTGSTTSAIGWSDFANANGLSYMSHYSTWINETLNNAMLARTGSAYIPSISWPIGATVTIFTVDGKGAKYKYLGAGKWAFVPGSVFDSKTGQSLNDDGSVPSATTATSGTGGEGQITGATGGGGSYNIGGVLGWLTVKYCVSVDGVQTWCGTQSIPI